MGAWIEIYRRLYLHGGLRVAPLVGAWIEIIVSDTFCATIAVAPLVGAWIEICMTVTDRKSAASLPLWERGLKYAITSLLNAKESRSPCGSVD